MGSLRQPVHRRFAVDDDGAAGVIRRAAGELAHSLGAAAEQRGRAELVATELATNLFRHVGPGGWILLRPIPPRSVELLSVDRGPGIRDLAAALDGRTRTPSGLGRGLGAIRRMSARFDISTAPGQGTTVLSVVDLDTADPPARPRRWAGVSVGLDEACGDGWAATDVDDGVAIAVVDGLGHGVYASDAADAALTAFAETPTDLPHCIERANEVMRGTRGGAVALCHLEPRRGVLHHVGVGNVSARIVHGGEQRGLVSFNGTVGMRSAAPRVKVFCYPWPAGAILTMWTDGLTGRVDLARPGLLSHDPALAAATLHRDYSRERDDATVVVARNSEEP